MGGMVNRQGRCEGEGMRIERDWKGRRVGVKANFCRRVLILYVLLYFYVVKKTGVKALPPTPVCVFGSKNAKQCFRSFRFRFK